MLVHRLAQAHASRGSLIAAAIVIATFYGATGLVAQESTGSIQKKIDAHLAYGEFPMALQWADSLSGDAQDDALQRIAIAQQRGGASDSINTLQRISSDQIRYKTLFQVGGPFVGGPVRGNGPFANNGRNGNRNGNGTAAGVTGPNGGVTEADFQPLIDLIKGSVDPDSWDDVNGDGTIQAYPAGVYVDSEGTLHKIKVDAKRSLRRLARRSSQDSGNRSAGQSSALRKISLNRLEKQAQILSAQGLPVSELMQNLAGIYEIQYLMLLPESGDIVIAGPAGDWEIDADGHAVNVKTGKPVLQLDDLVVCLRNAQPAPRGNNGKFGCSITPRKQNLIDTQKYIATSKKKGNAWRRELRDVLGLQDIEVFGIDPATHAGRVLVEADYRMKLVAMDLEPTINEIPSYLSRLTVGPNGEVSPTDVVRWWFTMNYDEVLADEDRQIFTFTGTGVKVLSENEFITAQGERVHTGKSDAPTAGFARDFTKHFDKIADEYPVYRRLKNLFDLAIVSALIRSQRLDRQIDWNLTYFGTDPEYADHVYQPTTAAVANQVQSVINHRVISRRKESSTVKHTLIGVSGGITFDAMQVLRSKAHTATDESALKDSLKDAKQDLATQRSTRWWWD